MPRDQYIAMGWRSGEVSVAGTAALVRAKGELERSGWRTVYSRPGLWVFGSGDTDPQVLPLGVHGGVIIGDVFDASGATVDRALSPRSDHDDPIVLMRWLSERYWGRYVALAPCSRGRHWGVFRDPLGGLDALAWQYEDVVVAASDLPEPLLRHVAQGVSIDWRAVCGVVADPPSAHARNLLTGINAVAPGEQLTLMDGAPRRDRVWSPSQIARQPCPAGDVEADLRATIDLCVKAWTGVYAPVVAEVSGGLDSSIVASALITQGADVVGWINHHIDHWVGDERPYARALADHLQFDLTEIGHPDHAVRPETFMAIAGGPTPSFSGADAMFDEGMGAVARLSGAKGIMTGQGGDVVFFQMNTPHVAADRLWRLGFRALSWRFLYEVAEMSQQSIWSVLRAAVFGRRRDLPGSRPYLTQHARKAARRLNRPAFLADLGRTPRAKRLQITNLAYIQVVRGRSRRGEHAAILHPLLSQPLVELCLRIPSDQLVQGGRTRGLARDAFSGRLPPLVVDRRTKGDMTSFYGHAIASGLDEIRAFLLDGRLVAEGIVGRAALDQVLSVEQLAQAGDYGDVFDLLAVEAWVRTWELRLASLAAPAREAGPINGSRNASISAQ